MIQSWENLVTDGQKGRQTDESDLIGRCPTTSSVQKYIKFKIDKITKFYKNREY